MKKPSHFQLGVSLDASETNSPSKFRSFARSRAGRPVAFLIFVVVFGGGLTWWLNAARVPTSPGPSGWTIYHDPTHGWTLQFPARWHAQGIKDRYSSRRFGGESYGVLLSNLNRRFDKTPGQGPWNPDFTMRGMPATLVAIQVSWTYGSPFAIGKACTDSPMPLSLTRATRTTTATGTGGTTQLHLVLPFRARGELPYQINAWIGSQASKGDLARLDRIVASISFADVAISTPMPGIGCGDQL
jgi:hypothetical protein